MSDTYQSDEDNRKEGEEKRVKEAIKTKEGKERKRKEKDIIEEEKKEAEKEKELREQLYIIEEKRKQRKQEQNNEKKEKKKSTKIVKKSKKTVEEVKVEKHKVLGNFLVKVGEASFYETDSKILLKTKVKGWVYNRKMKETHINRIKESLETKPYLIGTIKIARQPNGKLRILDGQHRCEALRRIMKNDEKFNIKIVTEIYDVEDIDEDIKTEELFKNCNTVLNIEENDIPCSIIKRVIQNLRKKNNLVVESKGKIYKPRMRLEDLKTNLIEKEIIKTKYCKKYPHKAYRKIINLIDKLNAKFLEYSHEDMKKDVKDCTLAMYEKAIKTTKFPLSLVYPNYEWIDFIINKLDEYDSDSDEDNVDNE